MHNGINAYCIIVLFIVFNCFSVSNTIVDSLSIKNKLILKEKLRKMHVLCYQYYKSHSVLQ